MEPVTHCGVTGEGRRLYSTRELQEVKLPDQQRVAFEGKHKQPRSSLSVGGSNTHSLQRATFVVCATPKLALCESPDNRPPPYKIIIVPTPGA